MAATMEIAGSVPPSPSPARLAAEDYVDRKLAELRAGIYRAMPIQTDAIVVIIGGIPKLFP